MPINRDIVENDLIALSNCDNSEDFVAIGIEVNDEGIGQHSGLVISLDEQLFLFHFNGDVLLQTINNIPDDLYIKTLEIVSPQKVEYFKGFCEILQDEVQPIYGWVFTDSFYNGDGTYYSDVEGMPDITTCVGFCINVIRGFLYNNEQYIAINEWDNSSLNDMQNNFMQQIETQLARIEEIDPERLAEITQGSFKRITPSELTSSGFYQGLPITKANVDFANPTVIEVLVDKHTPQQDEIDLYNF